MLAEGINPSAHKKATKDAHNAKSSNDVEIIALEWHSKQKRSWTPSHSRRVLKGLEKGCIKIFLFTFNEY